jgi:drug/metabolite transporter (DMT)-like permease
MKKKETTLGLVFIVIVCLFYGAMPAIQQMAYKAGASVETVLVWKYSVGLSCIWIYIAIRTLAKKANSDFTAKVDAKKFWFLMLTGIAAALASFTMGESYANLPAAIASILVFAYIIYINAFELITGKEKFEKMRMVCLVLVVIGLVAVTWTPFGGLTITKTGLMFGILSGIFYTFWVIGMGSKKVAEVSGEVMMGYIFILPVIAYIIYCIIRNEPLVPTGIAQFLPVIILGIGPGFIAPVLFCKAVKILGGSTASMFNSFEPVVAFFAGLILMGDKLTWNGIVGGIVIVVAIFLINFSSKNKE